MRDLVFAWRMLRRAPFFSVAAVMTLGLGIAWGVVLVLTLVRLPERSPTLFYASLAFPIYYFALSFYLHFGRRVS